MVRNITALVFICFLSASCRFKKESIHYVVNTPAGWVRADTVDSEGLKESTFKPAPDDTTYTSGQNIAIIGLRYDNVDEYLDKVYAAVKKKAVIYNEIKRVKTKLNGYEARWIDVRLSFPSNPDVVVEQKSYFVADRGMIFMIICTTPEGELALMQDKFDELLKSFKTETDSKK